jgi:uncharacterized membrane protein
MTKNIPTWLLVSILFISFLGFMDATFLAGEHFLHMTPPCFIVQGCDVVTTSAYSKIFGIPVSLLGVFYYLAILVSGLYYAENRKPRTLQLMHAITTLGLIMSLWFLYAQAFIIKAWCLYCLFSAGTSIILFILCAFAFHKRSTPPITI